MAEELPYLRHLDATWGTWGEIDPLWAVRTDPGRRGNRWDLGEFFTTGEIDVTGLLGTAAEHIDFGREAALDFGCGVGRLTQALASRFQYVTGVDLASSMIEAANRYNRHPQRCRYTVNSHSDLRQFTDDSFDFVLSWIVLQHMHPVLACSYIREFLRLLRRGGVAVLQLPHRAHPVKRDDTLPDAAFNAALTCDSPPVTLTVGARKTVRVRVTNRSYVTWSADLPRPIRVGNHWYDVNERELVHDDGRAWLSEDVAPGAAVDVAVEVVAPSEPGRYTLEFDVVQEGVAWFGERGSRTLRLPVGVGRTKLIERIRHRRRVSAGPSQQSPVPFMEMHVVPIDEVRAVVDEAGGHIAHMDTWSTEDFDDACYYVTKRGR